MEGWAYIIVSVLSVGLALGGNYFLQKKLIKFKNKETSLDFLVSIVKELENLYICYWSANKHNKETSLAIRRKELQLQRFIVFVHKKYTLNNKASIDNKTIDLLKNATDENFDSLRMTQNLDKSTKISKLANALVLQLLENKL